MSTSPTRRVPGLLVVLSLLLLGVVACGDDGAGSSAQIAFGSARDGGGLYLMGGDGGEVTWIPVPSGGSYPDWGPDGRIAFTRMVAAIQPRPDVDIFVTRVDGSEHAVLIDGPGWDIEPAWSPNGDWIAFTSDRDGDDSIYLARGDGTNPMLLVGDAHAATWRDDSLYIAYVARRDGNTDIYTIDITGSETVRLTDDPEPDREPDWSPDGTKIVFTSARDGDTEIYVMNADGSGQTRLTNSEGIDGLPCWSPDGTSIVFISERDGPDFEIYVMDADGSNVTRLTDDPANDVAPDWGG